MPTSLPPPFLRYKYEKSARDYLHSLPLEHFMEATPQATQRKITLESLDLVHARRPEVQVFNELLVQYPRDEEDNGIGKVVPDNMVVLWNEPIVADGSYDLPLQPTKPHLVLEYVSKNSERKDYEENMVKYEQHLKIPYYLVFYPEIQDLTLFRLTKGKYVSVRPNRQERYPIAKLDVEVALLDGWVRFWFEGELLPLPADLLHQLDEIKRELAKAKRQVNKANRRAEEEQRRAEEERQLRLLAEQELARLREQLENRKQG